MARISKSQYFEIITNFPWSNLNKEITGDVLRQFIVNILDSVPEMTLIDGKTIEQAIQELRNRTVGNGSSVDFSDQFKAINSVVFMDVSLITANEEEPVPEPDPDIDPQPEPEPEPEPGEESDPNAPYADYLIQKDVDGFNMTTVNGDVKEDYKIIFYPPTGVYSVVFINRVYLPEYDPLAPDSALFFAQLIKVNHTKLGFPGLFLPQSYYLRYSVRSNQQMRNSTVGGLNIRDSITWFDPYRSPNGMSTSLRKSIWGPNYARFDWYYDTGALGYLRIAISTVRNIGEYIEAGSWIEFYEIRITQ